MSAIIGETKDSDRTRWLCWCGALLPVLTGMLWPSAGPQVNADSGQRGLSGLVFSQYMVNEGVPEVQPYYYARFSFKNVSNETVTITELRPSCGCLNPKLEQRVYKPGEGGEFHLRVDPTKEKPGPHEYFVDVHYEDPQPRSARLTYKLTLLERKIEVAPKALVFYQLSDSGESTSQKVVISDYRSRHFEVLGVESTSPLATAELVSTELDEAENQHVTLDVTVTGSVPPGTSRALINLRTDDEIFKVIQVPILIRGRNYAIPEVDLPLKIDPKSLYMYADENGQAQASLTFQDYQPKPVTLKHVSLSSIEGTVKLVETDLLPSQLVPRRTKIELSLQIPPGVEDQKGILVIETDSNLQPRMEVPIVIESLGTK
ncbi:MAG TPA: DUF1573 domain-containing protein [Planctomycetaceae bacterium]|nr:DUF1573 domain-containing protein [Planctomycetaceae bacterium]